MGLGSCAVFYFNEKIMRVSRTESVSVTFPAANRKVNFPDNNNIKGQKITGLIVRLQSETAFDFNNNPVASDANIRNTYLTLTDINNNQVISYLPLSNLIPSLNNGRQFEFEGLYIDLPKCFIYLSGTGTIPAGDVIVFTFIYELAGNTKLLEDQIRIQKQIQSNTTKC
ncbi:MAG: hypothetical protein RML94_02575 [Bacteroidia bacterium]|nr:hypothetical protein [Bacteroidia bacterium]